MVAQNICDRFRKWHGRFGNSKSDKRQFGINTPFTASSHTFSYARANTPSYIRPNKYAE